MVSGIGMNGRQLLALLKRPLPDRMAQNDNRSPEMMGGAMGSNLPADDAGDIAPPYGQPECQPIRKNRRRHRARQGRLFD